MNKVILLLLATSLSIGQSAFASEAAYDIKLRKEFKMPPEWFSCKMTSDCGLVPVPCMASLAVSIKYINVAQNAIEKKLGPFRGCDASMRDNSTAACDNGQCMTIFKQVDNEDGKTKNDK